MKYSIIISVLIILAISFSFNNDSLCDKIKEIDKYASQIDSNLKNDIRIHHKCCDCFGTDMYYKDSTTLVKTHNYQSCFNINYYYKNKRLILVTIDGSFKRDCGWTEANYCWDSLIVRNYKARIYYDEKNVLKEIETGVKPCCEIRPCGSYGDVIDFDKKAKVFLEKYGQIKDE